MDVEKLKTIVCAALEDIKAQDVTTVDLNGKSDIADYMIIANGTSSRHLRAIAANVVKESKKNSHTPLGIEGEGSKDWVLVDLGAIVVHIMNPEARQLYALEKLWSVTCKR